MVHGQIHIDPCGAKIILSIIPFIGHPLSIFFFLYPEFLCKEQ